MVATESVIGSDQGLPAGVVTGDAYRQLVAAAKSGGHALPAVNVVGTHGQRRAEAAAKSRSDVIIQLSNGGAQFYAGQGMPDGQAKVLGGVSAAQHVHLLAQEYGVCVVLHTDHANKKLVPRWKACWTMARRISSARASRCSAPTCWICPRNRWRRISRSCPSLKRMAPLGMSLEEPG